ncbi:uncharacterized protein LOC135623370 [Musa acuminata AAA Group]|uniref:uncharacterized protein LOC135623370 n=1 Tax=Musa acuminata AAA Group TaxID=214697 RepID=UPI0031D45D09
MAVSTAADDDPDEWVRDAFLDPHLVAAVILGFGRRSRLGLETEGDEKPSTSATPAFLGWGRKRSRVARFPRTATRTIGEEEDEGVTVAVEKRKGQRRASPQSPLEGYSSASGSGGGETGSLAVETPEDRRLTKAVGNPRTPSVSSIPVSASIRRPPSKKLTKPELQAVERSLLEEKANLHKEMEELRRAVEELRANNRKLQMHLKSLNIPERVCMAPEDYQLPGLCQQCITQSPGHEDFIIIPDLNDPLPDC